METEDLDLMIEQKVASKLQPVEQKSAFAEKMDEAKLNILEQAAAEDQNFAEDVTKIVKQAAVQSVKNERKTAELAGQRIDYESEKVTTQQLQNENQQNEDKWSNKQKCREFHYNGVKPIMEFLGIHTPMNLGLLYFLAIVGIIPFLLAALGRGTVGALICGANDGNRPMAARGFMWTVLAVVCVFVLFMIVYLFLLWQGIDILQKFKQ